MRYKFYPKFCKYLDCFFVKRNTFPSYALTVEDGKPICRIRKKSKDCIEKEECDVFRVVPSRMNEFKLFILLEELKVPVNKNHKWIGIK